MKMRVHLWLRSEIKPGERRAALTPEIAGKLVNEGFKISVERSNIRTFNDEDYAKAGCVLVEGNSWKDEAPRDAIVIGLKDISDENNFPLEHEHIYFAHCYKNQEGWDIILRRFKKGGGTLYDLEYLCYENGKRVAAYGFYAGICGCAIGLGIWAHNKDPTSTGPYKVPIGIGGSEQLAKVVKQSIDSAMKNGGVSLPTTLVIGYMGRCGSGALKFLDMVGIPRENILLLDSRDTCHGKPIKSILNYDILVNCIYLSPNTKPFITKELIESTETVKLSVIADISCDPSNPLNPIPIYDSITTLESPVRTVKIKDKKIDIMAIDNLPTVLPSESSEEFCTALYPHLLNLPQRDKDYVWSNAKRIFLENVKRLEE